MICRKRQFQQLIKKYERFFPDDYDFMPNTYILPEDYKSYRRHLDENPDRFLIVKPSRGKGGDGIMFVKHKDDIGRNTMRTFEYVAQEYVKNPLLIDKKKFDFRIYLLIRGISKMEAYVALEGMARFCTEDYVTPK